MSDQDETIWTIDKTGNPISSLEWAKLQADHKYKFHLITEIPAHNAKVITIYDGLNKYGNGANAFATMAFIAKDNEGLGTAVEELGELEHMTEEEAVTGHLEHVKNLLKYLGRRGSSGTSRE